jgi:hypothetical protein
MMVDTFVEMFEMEIVEKKGTSCRRLPQTKILEGGTKDEMRLSRSTFPWLVAQMECSHPSFQNLRLGGVK